MSTLARIAGFVAALVAVFAGALVVGKQVGPLGESASAAPAHEDSMDAHGEDDDAAGGHEAEAVDLPGGLAVSDGGHTLRLSEPVTEAGPKRPVSFVVEGPDGPVTAYDVEHGKRLHLIAVRRDFSGYQHVHPTLAHDGTWTTRLDLTPGQWRLFADFTPRGGENVTLGTDLLVPGDVSRPAPAEPTREAEVGGYTVRAEGDLVAGEHSELTLTVTRGGRPVTDLQPYLGAYGHLVALRSGDLAYLHVHPDGEPGDGETDAGTAGPVRRGGAQHRHLPPLPGLQARRRRPHGPVRAGRRRRPHAMTTEEHAVSTQAAPQPGTSIDLDITGMTCASCANRIERKLNKVPGVSATVNYATEKAKVSYPGDVTPDDLVAVVESAGYAATVPAPVTTRRGDPRCRPTRSRRCASGCSSRACSPSPWWPSRWCRRGSSTTGSGCRWRWPHPSWSGAHCPSTAPRGPTCATAPRRWTPSSRWARSRRSAGRSTRCSSALPAPPA